MSFANREKEIMNIMKLKFVLFFVSYYIILRPEFICNIFKMTVTADLKIFGIVSEQKVQLILPFVIHATSF